MKIPKKAHKSTTPSPRSRWMDEERQEALERGAKKLRALEASYGQLDPVLPSGDRVKMASSFWGHAWCRHLENFMDYESRLPRGRTYLRQGLVKHLHIEPGVITALVQGSELYEQTVRITPLDPEKWHTLRRRLQGQIGSLIELLQGKISAEILSVVTDPTDGIFPQPDEIRLDCSCPDWASLCKHLAAVLYGVGARLDTQPELLFLLRGVDHRELLTTAGAVPWSGDGAKTGGRRRLTGDAVAQVFGDVLGPSPNSSISLNSQLSAEAPAPEAEASEVPDAAPAGRDPEPPPN